MLSIWRPTEIVIARYVCPYHRRHPGEPYAGCTCRTGHVAREKPPEKWTEEERKRYNRQFDLGEPDAR